MYEIKKILKSVDYEIKPINHYMCFVNVEFETGKGEPFVSGLMAVMNDLEYDDYIGMGDAGKIDYISDHFHDFEDYFLSFDQSVDRVVSRLRAVSVGKD